MFYRLDKPDMQKWYLNIKQEARISTVVMLPVLFLVLLATFSSAKHLPSYIKTCKRNDPNFDDCVKKHALEAIPALIKGDKDLKTPVLEPYSISEVTLDAGGNTKIKLKDIILTGIGSSQLEEIKIDLEKKHFYIKVSFKTLNLDGQYDIDGTILVLPIKGTGPFNLHCKNMVAEYSFDYNLIQKNGKEWFDTNIKPKATYKLEELSIRLDNLFNGDKALGDRANEFLNEHALELNNDFSGTFSEIINAIATNLVTHILPVVSDDELFP